MKHLVNIDLNNNQLLNAVIHNLATEPSDPSDGQMYYNTSVNKLFARVDNLWVDVSNIYNHPTFTSLNPTLSGANILASIEVNAEGHVIEASTRLLTLADLGYTGDLDANKYIHETFTGNTMTTLSGAQVISKVQTNNEGHTTGFLTRNLTPADIGAAVINDSVTNSVSTWSSSMIQSEIDSINNSVAGALVYVGSYNALNNAPNLDNNPVGVSTGHTYVVSSAGTFYSEEVQNGDMLIAKQNDPTLLSHWTVINKNIPDIVDATNVEKGIIRIATQTEVNAGVDNLSAVTPATLVSFYNAQQTASGFAINIGDGSATSYDITHSLSTKDVMVQTYYDINGENVVTDVRRTSDNVVRILVNQALGNNEIRVLITKR